MRLKFGERQNVQPILFQELLWLLFHTVTIAGNCNTNITDGGDWNDQINFIMLCKIKKQARLMRREESAGCVDGVRGVVLPNDPRWAETVNCIPSAQRYKLLAALCLYYWSRRVCCFPVTSKSCAARCGERCPRGADTEWKPRVPSSASPSQGQSRGLLYYTLLFTKGVFQQQLLGQIPKSECSRVS